MVNLGRDPKFLGIFSCLMAFKTLCDALGNCMFCQQLISHCRMNVPQRHTRTTLVWVKQLRSNSCKLQDRVAIEGGFALHAAIGLSWNR